MVSADCKKYSLFGCGGFVCLWAVIILITVLASIRVLGPEDQILVEGPEGKYTIDGPRDTVVHPFRKKESRKAFKIGPRQYLVVKNQRSGLISHEEGDGKTYFFLGAWDESMGIQSKTTLTNNQYMRMIDELTGYESVVRGPKLFTPKALEHAPKGIETGIIISAGKSVLTLNKTTGIRNIRQTTGLFIPEAYEEILSVRSAFVVDPKKYAKVKDTRTGQVRHEEGPTQLYLGAYDELVTDQEGADAQGLYPKIVLQKKEYSRLIDTSTGVERVELGPITYAPGPKEKFKVAGVVKERGIDIATDTGVLVIDRKTGLETLNKQTGLFIPGEYVEVIETRASKLIGAEDYAVLRDTLTGSKRHVEGPDRFIEQEYEVLLEIKKKLVLQQDEYIRLVDLQNGTERVIRGPITFSPEPSEFAPDGQQKSIFIDRNTSLIVLDRTTGMRRLETTSGAFVPIAYETILEQRFRIGLFNYETMIIRDDNGDLSMRSGQDTNPDGTSGAAFFLEPYEIPVTMEWSVYDLAHSSGKNVPRATIEKIDMRRKSIYFTFEARTKDNVKLTLNGTIYWKPLATPPSTAAGQEPVVLMIKNTADPTEDIWYHCRSKMIQAVGNTGIEEFTANMTQVSNQAFQSVIGDATFYSSRGLEVEDMELSGKEPVEQRTKEILDQITTMGIDLRNQLAKQETANQVALEELQANLVLEQSRQQLIEAESSNLILEARTQGEAEGLAELEGVKTFLDDLGAAVSDESERIALYRMHEVMKGRTTDIQNMKNGNVKLFMTPDNMDIRMDMSGMKDGFDRRLAGNDQKAARRMSSAQRFEQLKRGGKEELDNLQEL